MIMISSEIKVWVLFHLENNFITKATTATIAKIIITPTHIPVLKTSPMNSHPLTVRGINNKSNILIFLFMSIWGYFWKAPLVKIKHNGLRM